MQPDVDPSGLGKHVGRLDREIVSPLELVSQYATLLLLAQVAPFRDGNEEPKAIGEGRVQGFCPQVRFLVVISGRRVHGRPTITQFLEFHPLYAPLVHDGEELVLQLGLGSVYLVEENHLGVPDGRRSGDIAERLLVLGRYRESHKVVEIEQAGVVTPEFQFESFRQTLQQKTFGRPVAPDKQKGLL